MKKGKSDKKAKGKLTVEDVMAQAEAAGLTYSSTGVNTAALNGTTGPDESQPRTAQAAGCGTTPQATVNWQRLPPEYLAACSEEQWQKLVKDFAEAHGWTCYHTLDSRGSDDGFPDLTMIREGPAGDVWLYFAELKREGGVESAAQKKWARLLAGVGHKRVRHYLWHPHKWEVVQRILSEPMPE